MVNGYKHLKQSLSFKIVEQVCDNVFKNFIDRIILHADSIEGFICPISYFTLKSEFIMSKNNLKCNILLMHFNTN